MAQLKNEMREEAKRPEEKKEESKRNKSSDIQAKGQIEKSHSSVPPVSSK